MVLIDPSNTLVGGTTPRRTQEVQPMLALWNKILDWAREEKGASMVEYALLVVLIAIIAIVAVSIAGENVSEAFSNIASGLDAA
jgi:pilus assembly protein Flp/PilA